VTLKMKKMTMIGSTRFTESTRRSGRSGLSAPNEWFLHGRVPIDASVQRREAPVLAVGPDAMSGVAFWKTLAEPCLMAHGWCVLGYLDDYSSTCLLSR
jgi:hypothetical protein